MDWVSAAITLYFVMDPIGNIPYFMSVLKPVEPARRQPILIRELFIALAALVLILLIGQKFLDLLHLTQESVSIAGGIILFIISLRMIFPIPRNQTEDELEEEPLVVPLAIPGVAGPSVLATILLLLRKEPGHLMQVSMAVGAAWLATSLTLLASPIFFKLLKRRGLIAMERLMGMILVALAVQMFLNGIAAFLDK